MKRFFAFILLLVFMTFKCITWVPSAAMTGIPAFDAFYYAVMQTLGMAVTNGVDLNMAQAIAETREAVPDYLQQPDVALKYLLRGYAGKAWDYLAANWENSVNFMDIASTETAAIGLANSSGVSVPTLQDIVKQWNGKVFDNDKDITTPINSNTISFWNKFNNLWINQYLERMNFVDADVPDLPDVPATIETYIDLINGSGFSFISNIVNFYFPYQPITSYQWYNLFPLSNYTFYKINRFDSITDWNFNTINFSNPIFAVNRIDNLYITSNNGLYSVTLNPFFDYNLPVCYNGSYDSNTNLPIYKNCLYGFSDSSVGQVFLSNGNYSGYNWGSPVTRTDFTLEDLFAWLSQKVRNVNIYLDGELISIAGYNEPISNFQASVPNSVIDTGTDDGKIVANPIYWVVDNNTGNPIDSQINLDKLIDYLKGVIDGSNDDTSVDFGDLVDAGVIEKQDGTAITDADVIAVPVADVIDDSIARTDPLVIPIAITGTLPPLPPLPPFFPTPDFPEGDPTSGFNGMSVLARIINITNQSLPDELIVVFYGVVFGAIVLGLIKILHK